VITISLCMIVKNEEKTLARCLKSVSGIADEIIIVDTGSQDKTKEIAREFTDRIYDFSWNNHFSNARNFSFEKAKMDYILWLDADDILLMNDRLAFQKLKHTLNPDVDAVMMKYNTSFDELGNPTFFYYRERLIKRAAHFRWQEPVHEYLQTAGIVINVDISITHAKPERQIPGTRNLEIYEGILQKGDFLSLRGLYYYARELKDNGRYLDAIKQFEVFIENDSAWVEDRINACAELSRCYLQIGNREKALLSLTNSFAFDLPRAEICCQIGYFYKEINEYKKALFWFKLILTLEMPEGSWGFIQPDCWGYIPNLECAVCYDKLGEYEKAQFFNDQAAIFKPESKAVAYNKRYFADLKRQSVSN